MKKRVTAVILTAALAVASLAGCGNTATSEPAAEATGSTVTAATEAAESTSTEDKTITVAASATPHAEILEQAKSILAEQGWDLQVTVFDDYVQPNNVVESGEFDANYFQHIPYLDSFNEEHGTHLVNAGGIHYEVSILEQNPAWMIWKVVMLSQFLMIQQTKQEHCSYCRIMVY